ncbi:ABC transporter permease [Ferroacidibacillus organovorans]|uniref:ABC transporter n=1 Tax=Ferroacidibacillus organovorans TaxID=1765683 RepID=A0A853KD21_9BACL|nr:ABC transporter permease [Ferroacidibacillus organovorans]KYP81595.1 ABC transporter [Ferroacidibacillus organovorans]OAG94942.1 ABC transporter [Ferroacidibacillus organovorans]
MRATLTYWKYELIRTLRDRRFFLLTLGMPVIFYFVFINQQGGALRIAGTFWSHYFMVSMASFGVVGSSINTLGVRLAAERQSGWVRYLRTTPLSSFGYAIAKILTQLTLSLLIILCIFLVAHFSQNVSLSGGEWLTITLWLWIGSLPFAALGVFIGLTGNAAQPLGTLMYLVASMLGGLWTPIQALPSVMQTIAKWTPTYHYAHPAWRILAGQSIQASDILVLLGWTLLFLIGSVALQRRIDTKVQM